MAGKPGTPGRKGPRPDMWKTGPDPVKHEQYTAWSKHRAQAHFRKEPYDLSFDDWCWVWLDNWHRRGRGHDDLMMTRVDTKKAWSRENCMLITRRTHAYRQMQDRLAKGMISQIWMEP